VGIAQWNTLICIISPRCSFSWDTNSLRRSQKYRTEDVTKRRGGNYLYLCWPWSETFPA